MSELAMNFHEAARDAITPETAADDVKGSGAGSKVLMNQTPLPTNVQNLISDVIDSVGTLEMLLLLYRRPEREWFCDDVAGEMRVERDWVQSQLLTLVRAGLFCESGRQTRSYRYYPASMELNAAVAELARTYATRSPTVISFIHSRPAAALRRFADAFRSRGREGND
jgi:hypothetical protein